MTRARSLKAAYWKFRYAIGHPREVSAEALAPWICRIARRNAHGVFAVDVHNDRLGFFAHLNICLRVLHFCERAGLTPYVAMTSSNYLDARIGPSWFDYFFDQRSLDVTSQRAVEDGSVRICRVASGDQLGIPEPISQGYYASIDLGSAHDLFERHIAVKPHIAERVERFVGTHFGEGPVLGVHFRGTDKHKEAPRVAWDICRETVASFLRENPAVGRIFVASDEAEFVTRMQREFRDVLVCHHEDRVRSASDLSIHLGLDMGDGYAKGEDALVNCLLLARCSALIKSASLLSGWASVFSPTLPVVMLNRPHRLEDLWFPENRIVARSMDQYLPIRFDG